MENCDGWEKGKTIETSRQRLMAQSAIAAYEARTRSENRKRVQTNVRDLHTVTSWYLIREQDVRHPNEELTPSYGNQRIADTMWYRVSVTHDHPGRTDNDGETSGAAPRQACCRRGTLDQASGLSRGLESSDDPAAPQHKLHQLVAISGS